jgi:hypothetical protein
MLKVVDVQYSNPPHIKVVRLDVVHDGIRDQSGDQAQILVWNLLQLHEEITLVPLPYPIHLANPLGTQQQQQQRLVF